MARRAEVNLVHFSFLDILFNFVGAILFMFIIYALMTNDLVEEKNTARIELNEQLEKIEKSKKNVDELKSESEKLKGNLEKIKEQVKESEEIISKAKSEIKKQKINLKSKDDTIKQLKKKVISAESGSGIDSGIDPTLMSEWGEAGGSEATKIQSKAADGNLETVIVKTNNGNVMVSGNIMSSPLQVAKWEKYYDDKNQKMQFLSDPEKQESFDSFMKDYKNHESEKGQGLLSNTMKSPSNYNQSGISETDANNDGKTDEIWYDHDLNGKPDKMSKDIDYDGKNDEFYFNWDDAKNKWKTKLVDLNNDGAFEMAFIDSDLSTPNYEIKLVDFNPQTGKSRMKYEDKDQDGFYDTKWIDNDMEDEDWEEVYSNFDKDSKRWAAVSMDTNNDGVPDVVLHDTDLTNDKYEEKEVDADYDGVFDSKWMDLESGDADWEAKYSFKDESSGFWKEVNFDTNGDGKWDVHGINTDMNNENFEVLMKDEDNDEKYEVKMEDTNSDGVFEKRFEDTNKDGQFEIEKSLDDSTGEYILKK